MSSPTSERGRAGLRRVASAILVALIAFGPSVALGEDRSATQAVTITVSAAPRTVSVLGDASISVPENTSIPFSTFGTAFPGNATGGNIDTSTTLSFSNPVGNDAAKVTVSRTNTALGSLGLTLRLDPAGASGYSVASIAEWAATQGAARTLVQNITAGTSVEPLTLAWRVHTLSTGDTGTVRSIVSTATFTIMDN
jgi:hypothetical protein